MKKTLLLLCLAMATVFCHAQGVYKITGTVSGLPDGDLYLISDDGFKQDTLAQTKSMSGSFLFSGQVQNVVLAYIVNANNQMLASLMLENAEYTVLGQDLVAGGGFSQQLMAQFNQLDNEMVAERSRLEKVYVEAEKNKDKKKMEAADAKFQKFLADAQTKELELLQKYANTYVAAYVVASTMRDVGLDKLRMRYDILGTEAKNTSFGRAIARQIQRYEQVEVGSVAPEFKLQALDNGIVSLHETKAKLKIVNFWASWSAPCRTENVNLLRLYEAYHLRGLEIFSVSIDDNAAAWKKAVNEDGMGEWKNVSDLKGQFSDLMLDYCLQTIPYTFILDEDNVILAKGLRGEELRKKVDELLKRK